MRRHAKAVFVLAMLCSFFALAATASAACPNEALRDLQRSTFLPECRAYEQVSPVDKNGANVFQAGLDGSGIGAPFPSTSGIAPSGDRITYALTGAQKDAASAPNYTFANASRGADWMSTSVSSPQTPWAVSMLGTALAFSRDQTATLDYSEVALAPGAIAGDGNYYIHDLTTGNYRLIAALKNPDSVTIEQEPGIAVGDGGSYAVFAQSKALTPDAVEVTIIDGGRSNLYQYIDGDLHLISTPGWEALTTGPPIDTRSRAVSADGSRVYFEQLRETGEGFEMGLFLSEDAGPPVPISVSHVPGDPSAVVEGEFFGASRDGSVAYFVSPAGLTVDTQGPGRALYRYEADSGELTAVTPAVEDSLTRISGWSATPVSSDGEYIYFLSREVLAPGGQAGVPNIYGWHDGETRLVGSFEGSLTDLDGQFSLSPDGSMLAFLAPVRLTSYDNTTGGALCPEDIPGRCAEVYVYDWDAAALSCASCPADGAPPTGHASLGGRRELLFSTTQLNWAQSIDRNGTVFFDTPQRLVPQDINGKRDAYAFRDGQVRLISTGKGAGDTFFTGTNESGTDLLIATPEKLVAQDGDRQVDLYDARVGGGIPSQQIEAPVPVLCSGTACQAAPAPPPVRGAPASSGVHGSGNATPRRSKAKRRCAAKRHNRAAKKQGRSKQKQAKSKQRARRGAACKGGNR